MGTIVFWSSCQIGRKVLTSHSACKRGKYFKGLILKLLYRNAAFIKGDTYKVCQPIRGAKYLTANLVLLNED